MSKEIKFRGISIQTKEFIYGDLLTEVGHKYILPEDADSFDDFLSVEYDTVGQYTGLDDKNGKEIYENDILTENILVIFKDGSFATTYKGDRQSGTLLNSKRCNNLEVIGNIHENPEILK